MDSDRDTKRRRLYIDTGGDNIPPRQQANAPSRTFAQVLDIFDFPDTFDSHGDQNQAALLVSETNGTNTVPWIEPTLGAQHHDMFEGALSELPVQNSEPLALYDEIKKEVLDAWIESGRAPSQPTLPDAPPLLASLSTGPFASLVPETVCFGRITNIRSSWKYRAIDGSSPKDRFPVRLLKSYDFALPGDDSSVCGSIASDHWPLLSYLLSEPAIELHVFCTVEEPVFVPSKSSKAARTVKGHRPLFSAPPRTCLLDMTLYGPTNLLGQLDSRLRTYSVNLQDPIEQRPGARDVIYHNPQLLSVALNPESCILVSEFILRKEQLQQQQEQKAASPNLQSLPPQPDVLEILSSHIELADAVQPDAIKTNLKTHQKQAITFMLERERGWSYGCSQTGAALDLWQMVETDAGPLFRNSISERYQEDEPPAFSGGIIADPMGLGKTLTMIALVATDLEGYEKEPFRPRVSDDEIDYEYDEEYEEEEFSKMPVPATLIVVSAPLLSSWEEQINEHVVDGKLRSCRHHGKKKLTNILELQGIHIVLTTYDTVLADWKAASQPSFLFSIRWRRIILDEAHAIKSGNAGRVKASCALSAMSRWAVTGTPIQNGVGDLAALLCYIRAYPYTDPKVFNEDMSRLWKNGDASKAVKRLQLLSTYLVLRRPKTAIELPPRHDLEYPIDLTPAERKHYDAIHSQALSYCEEAMCGDVTYITRMCSYANALDKIDSLRHVCDLGLHYSTRLKAIDIAGMKKGNRKRKPADSQNLAEHSDEELWQHSAQKVFDSQRNLMPMHCMQCAMMLEWTDTSASDKDRALFTCCLKFICTGCTRNLQLLPSQSLSASPVLAVPLSQMPPCVDCCQQQDCPIAPVSIGRDAWKEMHQSDYQNTFPMPMPILPSGAELPMPSKISALLTDLRAQSPTTKCIVFSNWRITLDLIQQGLEQINMHSIRFDGKVPLKERQPIINRFRSDPSIRVMLLTLSCGAVGLNLTVATRAYLMEPHWNPTVEEQALARIHRLGQTSEVTTVRFCVKSSIEEQIKRLQAAKNRLASVLLSHHDTGQVDDNLSGLQEMHSLLYVPV